MDAYSSQAAKLNEEAALLRALADDTRRLILQILLHEELSVSELVSVFQQPQSTISRQLKVLRDAGMVRDRREGTASHYSANLASDNENGLACRLLGWLKEQQLPPSCERRLQHVLTVRREGHTFFDRLGKRWDDMRIAAFGDSYAFEAMISLLPKEWTVADIGVGTGYLLPTLANNFKQVIAVDPAEVMIECARQRIADHQANNVRFLQGDLAALPIAGDCCDLALAILVIHHVREPDAALAELYRVVRPGGRVLIVEQASHENQAFFESMQDLWWGFDPHDLSSRLAKAGFQNVSHGWLTRPNSRLAAESPPLFVLTSERADE